MINKYVKNASDLVSTHEATRNGFLEYALRKSKESVPYLDKAKAFKLILEQKTKQPKDILKLDEVLSSCYEAAGVSVKANKYLTDSDLKDILLEFIKEFLEPSGEQYIEELIYRYLLTSGDALGGRMRNLVGSIANEKLTRNIISQLQVLNISFEYYDKFSKTWLASKNYTIDQVPDIRAIKWILKSGGKRQLIYNLTVPIVKKNIDLVILNCHSEEITGKAFKEMISNPSNYELLGELKGGVDPAGADEHWKTANTALSRVRDNFKKHDIDIPLVFIGAAIEISMSKEIFSQYTTGQITNCANLTVENQLVNLCYWLVTQR
ncbi:AvaI/BsoBI family type II restriction endonuclease [Zobellia barbeyronii]|uniref:Type II site-specific deoxyribonuclease n=1 Tax=Zobellia barbeyronii TaxID=2748009 RepID=A0ABS5WKX8_9FLAO|nr:AvaI/BsoBI family type II restriction endonuclease [Zobellia barbeyronii]MBT2163648.1 type II site-specific deoxyribonuclease [Zobellia barbeyronii]